jgi:carbamoyl-phosphate synthase large subunit
MKDNFNILFTSSGRRVALVKKFKEIIKEKNINSKIVTADLKENVPTAFISDNHYIVPKVTDDWYIYELLDICQRERINLLIPLIDNELITLSNYKYLFEDIGVKVLVSGKGLNELACNKEYTYEFFTKNSIKTPKVYSDTELNKGEFSFPLLIKPKDGSASKGVTKINTIEELQFFKKYIPNAMVQEFISGEEYTVDVMVDFFRNIKTIVPRKRIEVRAGEVSKGVTIKDEEIIAEVEKVIKLLPDPVGCITVQCFKQFDGNVSFIEINPRFGGGIPLSIEAGANFPLWTIEMCQGEIFIEKDYSWKGNLTMLRYDDAFFNEFVTI